MAKVKKPKKPKYIKMCGGKKGKGSCNWAGATIGQTAIKIAA